MTVAGAGGLVFDDAGRVLLLRHASGSWVFPKGHIDDGEEPLQTAIRETMEEAGVQARCPDDLATFTTSYVNSRGEDRLITWFVLHADLPEFVSSEDLFPEGAFLEPEEATRLLSFPEDRRLLQLVLDHREGS